MKLTLFKDSASTSYSTYWKLTNKTSGSILVDSSKLYDFDSTNYSGLATEGFLTKVKPVTASVGTPSYTSTKPDWFDELSVLDATGVYYVGTDIPDGTYWPLILPGKSTVIGADRLRKVELRFGTNGKAYRYLNGYFGTAITAPNSYRYAAAVTATDTVGKGSVGNWDTEIIEPLVSLMFRLLLGLLIISMEKKNSWLLDFLREENRQLQITAETLTELGIQVIL